MGIAQGVSSGWIIVTGNHGAPLLTYGFLSAIRSILRLCLCFFGEIGCLDPTEMHPIPDKVRRAVVVGRFAGASSGTLHGLELILAKWRRRVPPTSTPEGA